MLKFVVGLSLVIAGGAGVAVDYSQAAKVRGADYGLVDHVLARADAVGRGYSEMMSYFTPPPLVLPVKPAPVAVAAITVPKVAPAPVPQRMPEPAPVADAPASAEAVAAALPTPPANPQIYSAPARTVVEGGVQVAAEGQAAADVVVEQPALILAPGGGEFDDLGQEGLSEAPSEGMADDAATLAETGAAEDVAKAQAKLAAAAGQAQGTVLASNDGGTTATRFADRACIMRAGVRTCGSN